jgi:hypothetical protein
MLRCIWQERERYVIGKLLVEGFEKGSIEGAWVEVNLKAKDYKAEGV